MAAEETRERQDKGLGKRVAGKSLAGVFGAGGSEAAGVKRAGETGHESVKDRREETVIEGEHVTEDRFKI